MTVAVPPVTTETGSIYDIGYRNYEGPRLGRAHAVRSLLFHTLRSAYGIGRGGRAKVAPITLAVLACIPAVAIIAALALIRQLPVGEGLEGELPIRYATYAGTMGLFIALFCAAQAPDLFGRDLRYSLLSLYFSRALRRTDYALARIGGFVLALFIFQLIPYALLFIGRVLLSTDIPKGIADDLPDIGAAIAQSALTAGLLGAISMAVAAFTPRRAFAVAGIIAVFVLPSIVVGIFVGLGGGDSFAWLILLSPTSVLESTNTMLFDSGFVLFEDYVPAWTHFLAAGLGIAGAIGLIIRRFSRITA